MLKVILFVSDSLGNYETRLLQELKVFRTYIKSKLNLPGLIVGEAIVRNEGQYSHIELTYPSCFR